MSANRFPGNESVEAAFDAMHGPYDEHEAEMWDAINEMRAEKEAAQAEVAAEATNDIGLAAEPPKPDVAPDQHVRIRPSRLEVCGIAVNLAKNTGWRVFPCRMPRKLPAISKDRGGNGYLDAVNDEAGIRALWQRGWGDLIGVATGAMSGIDVLDIDVKHEQAVKWWAVASKRIPRTRIYRTNGGGYHVYFRHAMGVKNNTSKLAQGVDVRGDGGYVISWFSDGCECIDHKPIAEWPAWLLECVLWEPPPPPPPPHPSRTLPRFAHKARPAFGQASADASINGIIQRVSSTGEGERNSLLFWGACKLREHEQQGNISKAEASGILLSAALSIGLNSHEAVRTIESAWRRAG